MNGKSSHPDNISTEGRRYLIAFDDLHDVSP